MKTLKSCRILTMTAILFGTALTIIPAYGQQEVNPTWYDPAPPAAAAVHSTQPQAAARKEQQKRKTAATSQNSTKAQTKRAAMQQTKPSSAL